eukprot:TRINITY_DN9079_c0_g1_i2.p1 TRINITY_DN9079_c0_g1~~TRINITY_DN9079_c0_g1_i2.p1  ORF type:complete len:179 (+),score=29.12 TRINITY_DN9079_c0_g1_i2:105-641(+)
MSLEVKATKEHCLYCFNVLKAYFQDPDKFEAPPLPEDIKNITAPIFVTWNTRTSGEKVLRGCIGTFSEGELAKLLPTYTLTSALKDRRFLPITKKELPTLECAVSLLVNFEEAKNARDWVPGKHGIKIFFDDDGRSYEATYLPEVAKEQGWDVDTTLKHLIRKAGNLTTLKLISKRVS